MSAKTVFISYSHDSDIHRERVLGLSERLRDDGIETLLDQYVNGSPSGGWPRWMLDQLDAADSVLVVCTETYYRRFRGHEEPDKGKGVDWEGALITQEIYDSRSKTLKFVPVLFATEDEKFIPEPLRIGTHYTLISASSYQDLYDFLLGQAGVEPGVVGVLKTRARPKGSPLTFGEEPATQATKADISRIIKYAPAELIGREAETKLLSDAWDQAVRGEEKRPRVLTFVALGGEGKTSLVAKWAAELAHQDWPDCDSVFAWSFYSQGTREQTQASSDTFLKEALTFFGDPAMAGSAQHASDKGRRLAQLVGEQRALLILDGLEPLQYAPTSPTPGELKDQGLASLLKGLAATSRGLSVVTTRYAIPDLRAFIGKTVQEEKLARLSTEAGVALLQSFGVKGSLRKTIPSADGRGLLNEFEKLVEDVKGHALTLNLLGSYLRDSHAGDIRQRDLIKLEEADSEEQGGHAFHVMDAYVKSFESGGKTAEDNAKGRRALAQLQLLGLFDRPATADCLNALWKGDSIAGLTEPLIGISEAQRNMSLKRLEDAKLVTVNRYKGSGELIALDSHPLLREYFARRVRQQQPEAWRAAHRRLYEHLKDSVEYRPDTLEDLQPLYQAVAHGCQAGMQQEACDKVFFARLRRGNENYANQKLGAFGSELGAVACFFETPWSNVSPALTETEQAWLLAVAAFDLRALGRLTEVVALMRAGLPIELKREDWTNAAITANNLSELELTLGEVVEAVEDGEQSVTYSDRSGDFHMRQESRCTYADSLHNAGRRDEAEVHFRDAEELHAKGQPASPLLYSIRGFRYCDLLLTEIERAAWQTILQLQTRNSELETAAASCRAVSQRAAQTLKIAESNHWLLGIALDHLTLARAASYTAILEKSEIRSPQSEIDSAAAGLRTAGQQHMLPHGLLSRAWLRLLEADSDGARADLDEAWEIAERGPMRLFMADIHLYRARLFHGVKPYPWKSPQEDLAAARKLIEQCAYGRRKEELEDAEAAAKNW
jgi:hypothetical protein